MSCIRRKAFAISLAAAAGLTGAAMLPPHAIAQVSTPVSQLTESYNASGQELLNQFSASPGNIVLSPYSIGTAMSMALSGARAETEREMLEILKHRLKREDIAAVNSELLATLKSYDRSATPPTCPAGMQVDGERCRISPSADGRCPLPMQREGEQCFGGATLPPSARLLLANALMVIESKFVSQEYAALLKDSYAAELLKQPTLADINRWVNRKTAGKIDKILDRLSGAAVLLDAVYFKSRWASPFDEKRTRNDAFSLSSAQQIQVPTMNRTGDYAVVARGDYRAIHLPYVVRALGMVIVLPNEVDGLAGVIRGMDAKEQSEVIASVRGSQKKLVALSLPRFKTEFKADLVPLYKKAGMKLAFDKDRADFSGITGKPVSEGRLAIGGILHRAMIEVSEESTEAAAATAVIMAPGGAAPQPGPQPEIFRVDRPFLFYLVDDASGAVLFTGVISDPRQRAAP
jgi:serpin B